MFVFPLIAHVDVRFARYRRHTRDKTDMPGVIAKTGKN